MTFLLKVFGKHNPTGYQLQQGRFPYTTFIEKKTVLF